MLSRRLIRVKVLQVLYSLIQQGDLDLKEAETLLQHSIGKSQDLYHLILQLPSALRHLAAKRIEIGRTKMRPTAAELNPNTRFAKNRLILELEENEQLNKAIETSGNTWSQDDTVIKTIFSKMTHCDAYNKYMNSDEDSFEADRNFVIKFMSKELPKMSFFFQALEFKNVFWNDEAEFMISMAIKTLKDFDGSNGATVELMPLYKDEDDAEFTKKVLRRSVMERENTIEMIKKYSKNWDADRVALLDVLLINMAIAEMTTMVNIPIKVTLNEYIEIAKFYSTDKSNSYINGLLEKIVRQLVEEKRISEAQLF